MAQAEIKSLEGLSYPVEALAQAQGPDVRVRDVQLTPLRVTVQECVSVPESNRPVLLPGFRLTEADLALQVSVIDVSGTRPMVNLVGR